MKICTKCNQSKELSSFSYKNKNKGTLQPICKSCKRDIDNNYYKIDINRRNSVSKSAKDNKIILKDWVTKYKEAQKCSNCNDSRPYVLDFHHTTDDKSFNISEKIKEGCSIKTLEKR